MKMTHFTCMSNGKDGRMCEIDKSKIENKKYFANSKIQFNQRIKLYLDLKYKNKKLSTPDIKALKYYLGNIDATAGAKLRKFLEKTI